MRQGAAPGAVRKEPLRLYMVLRGLHEGPPPAGDGEGRVHLCKLSYDDRGARDLAGTEPRAQRHRCGLLPRLRRGGTTQREARPPG